jgi:phage-related minor tail protein
MSAQEALGNFFKSIGSMFIQMATEIIAKQMVMITLGFIMKALGLVGGISSAGNAAGAAAFSPGNAAGLNAIPGQAFSLPKLAANGATFSNGIAKFATGGIVNGPTLFPFADGGAMQMGLMGEPGTVAETTRGPERPVARSDGVAVSPSTSLGTAARSTMTHTHAHAHTITMHDARTTLHDSTQQPTTIQDRGGG